MKHLLDIDAAGETGWKEQFRGRRQGRWLGGEYFWGGGECTDQKAFWFMRWYEKKGAQGEKS